MGQALQNAMNIARAVPCNHRPHPILGRARRLLLLATAGLAVPATTVVSAANSATHPGGADLGHLVRIVLLVVSVAVNAAAFLSAFRLGTARRLTVAEITPGAVAAAVIWQLLQTFSAAYVGPVVKHASETNSVFALVLGLLAFLSLANVAIVVCVEVNVVRVAHLHPRALLTPFTDHVNLTAGTGASTPARPKPNAPGLRRRRRHLQPPTPPTGTRPAGRRSTRPPHRPRRR